jgi:hypothetical protein
VAQKVDDWVHNFKSELETLIKKGTKMTGAVDRNLRKALTGE